MDLPTSKPSRIMVYGVTGSGKTTLARKLGETLGLPWHSMDDLTFEPGWVTVPVEEQRRKVAAICEGPDWVIDTAYGTWIDIPMERVELIVGLDYPRWLSLSRLTRRTIRRLFDKRPICNGNHESLKTMFSRDSILLWHFRSFDRKRLRMADWAEKKDGPKVLRFKMPRDVDQWLAGLGKA